MNRCKGCNKEIPDDRDLCEECSEQDLLDANLDDDYMEELLNSLSSTEEEKEESDNILDILEGIDTQSIPDHDENNSLIAEEDPLAELLNMMSVENVSGEDSLDTFSEDSSDRTSNEDEIFSLDEILEEENDFHDMDHTGADVGDVFSDTLSAVSSFQDSEEEELIEPEKNQEKKIGFFKKLFGNVVENEGKLQEEIIETSDLEDQELSSSKKQKKKKEKKDKEIKPKKEKKPKVKKPKEKTDIVVDSLSEGRINKVGASIVVSFFSIATLVVIFAMKMFVYSQNINNATDYFERQKYSEAYSEIQGIKLKEKDKKIFAQISTVMFVEKQLKSFQNYVKLEREPEALDSLLKGLKRYDKYAVTGKELGVKKELDLIRKQMLRSLEKEYDLSEKEAYEIIKSDSREKYSSKILDITKRKKDN